MLWRSRGTTRWVRTTPWAPPTAAAGMDGSDGRRMHIPGSGKGFNKLSLVPGTHHSTERATPARGVEGLITHLCAPASLRVHGWSIAHTSACARVCMSGVRAVMREAVVWQGPVSYKSQDFEP